ncbi:MAG TPA: hypothetical protein VEK57_02495 [Thermoanaerobaculia bacterium]|nr:hypothetical protein [Thermoanaerobaculia bacterium]
MRLFTVFLFLAAFYSGITTDDGNGFDPHGTPRTTAARCDDGSGLDPHGGPRCPTASQADAGWGIDPNG